MIPDDRLRLVFTCCHPALAREAQVALTLRLVCGVATAEIAHAFLVSEPTMAARITRAKKKIAAAGIPYVVPRGPAPRLDAVLAVIHLLSRPGTRRRRVRSSPGPTSPNARSISPACCGTAARRSARSAGCSRCSCSTTPEPRPATTRGAVLGWRSRTARLGRGADRRGGRAGRRRVAGRPAGTFTLQAAIAALHAAAPSYEETDWPQLLVLYDVLLRRLAVAGGRVQPRGRAWRWSTAPDAALEEVDALERDGRCAGYRYLPATKADLLRRLGRHEEAGEAYRGRSPDRQRGRTRLPQPPAGEIAAEDHLAGLLGALAVQGHQDRVVVGEPARELVDVVVARPRQRQLAVLAHGNLDVAQQLRPPSSLAEPQRVGLALTRSAARPGRRSRSAPSRRWPGRAASARPPSTPPVP